VKSPSKLTYLLINEGYITDVAFAGTERISNPKLIQLVGLLQFPVPSIAATQVSIDGGEQRISNESSIIPEKYNVSHCPALRENRFAERINPD